MNKSITILFGTRPEVIKLAPVILELRKQDIPHRIIHTGQHAELADSILHTFGIEPDERLNMMKEAQTPLDLLQRLLAVLPQWVDPTMTDLLLVQGDTTSALSGALTAFHQKVLVAHLEAGLRSHDRTQPFPEESNRTLISHLSDLQFAPTAGAQHNLLAENINPDSIHITGNSVVDALQFILKNSTYTIADIRKQYNAENRKLLLLTTHRRENFGDPIRNIFLAMAEISDQHNDLQILLPAHPNPEVTGALSLLNKYKNIEIIDPLSYTDFVPLMAAADLILTDSGGIQEEAPALGTPVFVLRNKTERPELIESGAGKLIGTDRKKIVATVTQFLNTMSSTKPAEVFGDGHTSERVVRIMRRFLEI